MVIYGRLDRSLGVCLIFFQAKSAVKLKVDIECIIYSRQSFPTKIDV